MLVCILLRHAVACLWNMLVIPGTVRDTRDLRVFCITLRYSGAHLWNVLVTAGNMTGTDTCRSVRAWSRYVRAIGKLEPK